MSSCKTQSSRFEQLPPEIQNQVYEYAACRKNGPYNRLFYRQSQGAKGGASRSKNSSLALTQVCRLTRTEFRPIFMSRQHLSVALRDVNKLLDAFFPLGQASSVKHRFEIRILFSKFHKALASLLPIFQLTQASPHITAGFVEIFLETKPLKARESSIADALNQLISPRVQASISPVGGLFNYPNLVRITVILSADVHVNNEVEFCFEGSDDGSQNWIDHSATFMGTFVFPPDPLVHVFGMRDFPPSEVFLNATGLLGSWNVVARFEQCKCGRYSCQ